jgi:hypothetical protein
MSWRFYARRAASNLWLDTNVQIDPSMRWSLNRAFSGQALIPNGIGVDKGPDGRDLWGRGDTVLFGEEDGKLSWAGICNIASPGRDGLYLEFTGAVGWWNNIPFTDYLEVAKTDVFDVVRMLTKHANEKPRSINVVPSDNKSEFTAGGTKGDYPEPPIRPQGQSQEQYENSAAYKAWLAKIAKYEENLGVGPYTIAWWEAPYVGEELTTLSEEYGFDWRERVRWADKANLVPKFRLDFADDITRRRTDIVFEDGINLASNGVPKEDEEPYAGHVIGLGAGEGRDMVRAEFTVQDERLYSARYMNYKTITKQDRLQSLVKSDAKRLSGIGTTIESVQVWDTPGFAPMSSLRVGDECRVVSKNAKPPYDIWHRVNEITRQASSGVVDLSLERRD